MLKLPADVTEIRSLIQSAKQGDKYSLAQLISVFENQKEEISQTRQVVLTCLENESDLAPHARLLGVTGTPGAGKSTLIGKVCEKLLENDQGLKIAVIAVDPASEISGGALLGDRTRVKIDEHKARFFFRSQSSNRDLGGVSLSTFQVIRLLRYFFDLVVIETVGIGQSEISIRDLVDQTVLVLQPLSGDQIQFLKAGIMEIPNVFVVNKCDQEQVAKQSFHFLQSSLRQFSALQQNSHSGGPALMMTSTVSGLGVSKLAEHIENLLGQQAIDFSKKERAYFSQWVVREYGRAGLRWLALFMDQYPKPFQLDQIQLDFEKTIHEKTLF